MAPAYVGSRPAVRSVESKGNHAHLRTCRVVSAPLAFDGMIHEASTSLATRFHCRARGSEEPSDSLPCQSCLFGSAGVTLDLETKQIGDGKIFVAPIASVVGSAQLERLDCVSFAAQSCACRDAVTPRDDRVSIYKLSVTIECRKGVADHIADVMSNEGGAINLQLIENSRYVLALRFLVVAAR
jgi:hypothetical protein